MQGNNFRVGEKVRIKSFDWYISKINTAEGNVYLGGYRKFTKSMSRHCGRVVVIENIHYCKECDSDHIKLEGSEFGNETWNPEFFTKYSQQLELNFET